jgi:hypothetical protein
MTVAKELNLASPLRDIEIEEDKEYWQALGVFIEDFASIESLVFTYLFVCSRTPLPMARALFSGVHIEQGVSFIKRAWQVLPPSDSVKQDLEKVFDHLGEINAVRNSLVHHGSYLTETKERVTSDISRALTVDRIREHRISGEDLIQMSRDLLKIGTHIIVAVTMSDASLEERAKRAPVLKTAWHYKRPSTQRKKPRKPSRKDRKP